MQNDVKFANRECVVLVFTKIGLIFCDGETASCVLPTIHIEINHLTRLYHRDFNHFSGPGRHENKWSCLWQLSQTNCSAGMYTLCARHFVYCCEQLLWSERVHTAFFLSSLQPWLAGKQLHLISLFAHSNCNLSQIQLKCSRVEWWKQEAVSQAITFSVAVGQR